MALNLLLRSVQVRSILGKHATVRVREVHFGVTVHEIYGIYGLGTPQLEDCLTPGGE